MLCRGEATHVEFIVQETISTFCDFSRLHDIQGSDGFNTKFRGARVRWEDFLWVVGTEKAVKRTNNGNRKAKSVGIGGYRGTGSFPQAKIPLPLATGGRSRQSTT